MKRRKSPRWWGLYIVAPVSLGLLFRPGSLAPSLSARQAHYRRVMLVSWHYTSDEDQRETRSR
jgi:hypothetical protein